MTLGQSIKKQRLKKQLLANYVAHKLGVSKSYLSMIESNNKLPTSKMMKQICVLFGLPTNYFDRTVKKELFERWA